MLEKILRFFERYVIPKPLYRLGQPVYHYLLAFVANIIYGWPSRKIFVLGVTGTKGKSTVIELTNAVLEAAGRKTAVFSSIRRKIGGKSEKNPTETTMPGRFGLQRFFREAVRAGCEYALVEVTSEGVAKHRHRFIQWDAALFLNLHPEHIEVHGSFEAYRQAKVDFFRYVAKSSKPRIFFFINEADRSRDYFEEAARQAVQPEIIFFSREKFVREEVGGHYGLTSKKSSELLNNWLLADFNLENAAAAVAFGRSQSIHWQTIKEALDKFKGVPGRLEFIPAYVSARGGSAFGGKTSAGKQKKFDVVIDYAHTPDSLEQLYQTLQEQVSKNLICVLGSAGGGRDKWKRPVMGKVAAKYCKKIILTNEDPYDENPESILDEIEKGSGPASKILDRKEAIKRAVLTAKKGDVVVISGKGSESWIHLARGKKTPWSERKVIEEILSGL